MATESFLAICPWDVERWFGSDSYHGLTLQEQGAYLNLCLRAFQRQPGCSLPDDDGRLWKMAGAGSREEWEAIRDRVLGSGGWALSGGEWTHPTVLEMYAGAVDRHGRAVKAGRIAGKASARVRRELAKQKGHGTIVQRSLNDRQPRGRSTIVNPPSPSPSPEELITCDSQRAGSGDTAGGPAGNGDFDLPAELEQTATRPPVSQPRPRPRPGKPERPETPDERQRRETAVEAILKAAQDAKRKGMSPTRFIQLASHIPPSNGHRAQQFDDPRAKGLSIEWLEATVKAGKPLLTEILRPPPL